MYGLYALWSEEAESYLLARSEGLLHADASKYRGRGRKVDPQPRRATAMQDGRQRGREGSVSVEHRQLAHLTNRVLDLDHKLRRQVAGGGAGCLPHELARICR